MFLSFLVPFRSMVQGSSHPSVDILVLVPYSIHGTRTMMSTNESRASNQRSSTRSWREFFRRAKTRTRTRKGFSRRAKTRTCTGRVVMQSCTKKGIRYVHRAIFYLNKHKETNMKLYQKKGSTCLCFLVS